MVKWVEQISHVLLLAVIVVLLILGVFLALWVAGHPAVADWSPALIVEWLVERGVRIVLLLAGSYLAIKIVNLLLSNVVLLIRPYDETPAAEIERQKRAHTLSAVLQKTAMALIIAVAILMVLAELNVNTTPILASVGVIGVALGFGAQQMVGDLIAGFFHIFENQIRVGDVAVINGTGGLVQDIRLRTTVLRGLDGTVHVFRNGSINTLSNMTKDFSYALLDLGVAYKEDTDHVCEVVREVAAGLQADEKFGPSILEPVEVIGVDNFADSAVIIRLRIKTLPIKQWDVAREFRRRIKYRFDQEGIEIPFPHRSIYFGEASKPFQVGVHDYSDRAAPPGSEGNPPAK
ncbi:MAG: mechanosensitive ion channel family protein [Acidobacteria bacterium]|nr:mechanosensitive ion channel family protein [Acidobacteriota bacterium]